MIDEFPRTTESIEKTKSHTIFAKICIGLMLLSSISAICIKLLIGGQIANVVNIPSSMNLIYILLSIGMILFLIFLYYYWKRWAFFGVCGFSIITLVLNIYLGVGIFSFIGLLGMVILYLSIRSEWFQYS